MKKGRSGGVSGLGSDPGMDCVSAETRHTDAMIIETIIQVFKVFRVFNVFNIPQSTNHF